jgi:RNA repair pathway DNA polymerase beta family
VIDPETNIPRGSMVILRAVVGSTVHGTNVSQQDDRDEMALAIEPMHYVIGMRHWETTVQRTQPDGVKSGPGDLDLGGIVSEPSCLGCKQRPEVYGSRWCALCHREVPHHQRMIIQRLADRAAGAIVIDKDVPLPRRRGRPKRGEEKSQFLPLAAMEPGDSFFVPAPLRSTVAAAVTRYSSTHAGMVFATRSLDSDPVYGAVGMRVWRVQ